MVSLSFFTATFRSSSVSNSTNASPLGRPSLVYVKWMPPPLLTILQSVFETKYCQIISHCINISSKTSTQIHTFNHAYLKKTSVLHPLNTTKGDPGYALHIPHQPWLVTIPEEENTQHKPSHLRNEHRWVRAKRVELLNVVVIPIKNKFMQVFRV